MAAMIRKYRFWEPLMLQEAIVELEKAKRVASSFGEDIEDIDDENEVDQARAKSKDLRYPIYPGLDADTEAVLRTLEDDPEAETDTAQINAANAGRSRRRAV